jgi:hypothetical protein
MSAGSCSIAAHLAALFPRLLNVGMRFSFVKEKVVNLVNQP